MRANWARAATQVLCVLVFLGCCAWGATGHKITAQIALEHLTPKAKAEVERLLEGTSLIEASVWADLIRGDPAWRWTAPWHYVNVPEGADGFRMDRDCPDSGCVVRGVTRYADVLRNKSASDEDKKHALMFLAHYVGDLHQPLHVGYAGDKGGNDIQVKLYSRAGNLHQVWDDGLLRRRGMDFGPYAASLQKALTPERQAAYLKDMDPERWADESFALARSHAYAHPDGSKVKDGDVLKDEYAERATPVVDQQLTRAGLRLAALLNGIFDPGSVTPYIEPSAVMSPAASAPVTARPSAPAKEPAAGVKFVGSRNSEVYHLPGCSDVKRIKPENLVEYREAPEGKRLHQGCPR